MKNVESVWDQIESDPVEAIRMKLKSHLMIEIRSWIESQEYTHQQAADVMDVQRSRVSDLMRGKIERFSIDMLVCMAARAELEPITIAT